MGLPNFLIVGAAKSGGIGSINTLSAGNHRIRIQIAVLNIVFQQSLALEKVADSACNVVRQLREFGAGGRLNPAKLCGGSVDTVDIDTVQE